MRVCLILPKYGVSINDPCCYPLGFMYVSAGLKRLGHDVDVFNMNLWDDVPYFSMYDVVLLTGGEEFLPYIQDVAGVCRSWRTKTVLGGALATFSTHEVKRVVDVVVVGEGDAIDSGVLRSGIFRGPSVDIHSVPWPDYKGFGIDEYHKRHGSRYMGVLTARGCPFSCSFCTHVCKYQERRMADVSEEIKHYRKEYDIEVLIVNDNTLNVRKSRFMEFCDVMRGSGIGWSAAIRTDRFDEEMCVAAKDAGAQYFVIGVESFQQDRLDRMNKRSTVVDNLHTLDLLEKYKIRYHGNVIVGFDWETAQDIDRELDAIPAGYNVFPALLQPFCGIRARPGVFGPEREAYAAAFRQKAEEKGMNLYPEVRI